MSYYVYFTVPERSVECLDDEIGFSLVLETDQELDDVSGRKFDRSGSQVLSGPGEQDGCLGEGGNVLLHGIGFVGFLSFGLKVVIESLNFSC